ncbi:hypothetical protein B2K_03760 [Paenibacillus mucilaginosus K02]|uniref:Uncharacterized protein n=1 Tax=Paenibacillus mucilaginosus K02 TaxID=997761 RepID=I0BBV5_9BACL|nr:hypothetical protein B2K_03760 [Paenibacillus mucilaginosus K02]
MEIANISSAISKMVLLEREIANLSSAIFLPGEQSFKGPLPEPAAHGCGVFWAAVLSGLPRMQSVWDASAFLTKPAPAAWFPCSVGAACQIPGSGTNPGWLQQVLLVRPDSVTLAMAASISPSGTG